jgi:hypothetical protein
MGRDIIGTRIYEGMTNRSIIDPYYAAGEFYSGSALGCDSTAKRSLSISKGVIHGKSVFASAFVGGS